MMAVILVGGEGNRMGKRVKPLLKKKGKTVLSYIIDNLNKYSINDICLVVNDKKQFKKLGYKTVKDFTELKQVVKEDFLLLVGDTIANLNFHDLINFHNKNPESMTVVMGDYQVPYGMIRNNKWVEKPTVEIAIGIFIYKPEHIMEDYSTFPN